MIVVCFPIHDKIAFGTVRKFDTFASSTSYRQCAGGVAVVVAGFLELAVEVIFQLDPSLSLLEHFPNL